MERQTDRHRQTETTERQSERVSWCFEPTQPLGIISGLRKRGGERERQTDRQSGRQTGKQIDRQTETKRERERERERVP